jgi:hypothetical protein
MLYFHKFEKSFLRFEKYFYNSFTIFKSKNKMVKKSQKMPKRDKIKNAHRCNVLSLTLKKKFDELEKQKSIVRFDFFFN